MLAKAAAAVRAPEDALRAIVELRARLDELEEFQVESAIRRGAGWAAVAAALGRSRQAVHKRYARRLAEATVPRFIVSAAARDAVERSRAEAASAGRRMVGIRHLLVALAEGEGRAGAALIAAGAEGRSLREARAAKPLEASRVAVSVPARETFERSLHEALALGSQELAPEHLLLALLARPDARRLLEDAGADPAVVERNVRTRA